MTRVQRIYVKVAKQVVILMDEYDKPILWMAVRKRVFLAQRI